MECKRYNFTLQSVSKCIFFAFNLETKSFLIYNPAHRPKQKTCLKIVVETSAAVWLITILLQSILQQQEWMI